MELLALILGLTLMMAVEAVMPFRPASAAMARRWFGNLGLGLINQVVMLGLGPLIATALVAMNMPDRPGLLAGVSLPWVVEFGVLVFSLQLVNYWLHRAYHRVPWLWRIHSIHHNDTEYDTTTALRNHPLEVVIGVMVSLPVVLVLVPDMGQLLGYNMLVIVVALAHHGNISLSERLENLLCYVVVTPNFHRVHHSSQRDLTDSNYAALLPLFDHLFGSARRVDTRTQKGMQLGLEYCRQPEESGLLRMLSLPFRAGVWSSQSAEGADEG